MIDTKKRAINDSLEGLIPGKPNIMAKHLISKCADSSEDAKGKATNIIMVVQKMKKKS